MDLSPEWIMAGATVVMAFTIIWYTIYSKRLWKETKQLTEANFIINYFKGPESPGDLDAQFSNMKKKDALKTAFPDKYEELKKISEKKGQ